MYDLYIAGMSSLIDLGHVTLCYKMILLNVDIRAFYSVTTFRAQQEQISLLMVEPYRLLKILRN